MIKKTCPVCNKDYFTHLYLLRQGYGKHCSAKCYGVDKKGYKPNKNQLRALRLGRGWNKGKKSPIREKHWNWKGGITEPIIKIRRSFEYKNWRTAIFERDDYTCVLCSARNGEGKKVVLNADHYPRSFSEIISKNKITLYEESLNCIDLWDISNGRTLCLGCHREYTRSFMKNNWRNQYASI